MKPLYINRTPLTEEVVKGAFYAHIKYRSPLRFWIALALILACLFLSGYAFYTGRISYGVVYAMFALLVILVWKLRPKLQFPSFYKRVKALYPEGHVEIKFYDNSFFIGKTEYKYEQITYMFDTMSLTMIYIGKTMIFIDIGGYEKDGVVGWDFLQRKYYYGDYHDRIHDRVKKIKTYTRGY